MVGTLDAWGVEPARVVTLEIPVVGRDSNAAGRGLTLESTACESGTRRPQPFFLPCASAISSSIRWSSTSLPGEPIQW